MSVEASKNVKHVLYCEVSVCSLLPVQDKILSLSSCFGGSLCILCILVFSFLLVISDTVSMYNIPPRAQSTLLSSVPWIRNAASRCRHKSPQAFLYVYVSFFLRWPDSDFTSLSSVDSGVQFSVSLAAAQVQQAFHTLCSQL